MPCRQTQSKTVINTKQVMEIGSGVSAAAQAVTCLVQRSFIPDVLLVSDVDRAVELSSLENGAFRRPIENVQSPVPSIPGRDNAVE